MRRLGLTITLAFAYLFGCHHPARTTTSGPTPAPIKLHGQPTWFPIGPDVYFEGGTDEVEARPLPVRLESRWFHGLAKTVTKAEFDAYVASRRAQQQMIQADGTFLPTRPPYPKALEDLPLECDGVRLGLAAEPSAEPGAVTLDLKLSSRDKAVSREVMHRWTNMLPFLFAFYVDGRAVSLPSSQFAMMFGSQRQVPLVAAGGTRTWRVRVDAASLQSMLPAAGSHRLCIAAAFSNLQHVGYSEHDGGANPDLVVAPPADGLRQVLVRSNAAGLTWDGGAWVSK